MGNANVHVFNQSCSEFHAEQKVVRVMIRLAGVNNADTKVRDKSNLRHKHLIRSKNLATQTWK
jgi:hypothetical protein